MVKSTHFKLDEKLKNELKIKALKENKTMNDKVVELIKAYVEK